MANHTKVIDLTPDLESFISTSIRNESPAVTLVQHYKLNHTNLKPMPVWKKVSQFFNQGTPSNSYLQNSVANLQHPNLHRYGTLHFSTAATF